MAQNNGTPYFLAIGPPKTATTWIYAALLKHPEVSLNEMKEVGYLWEKKFLPDRKFTDRFFNPHWFYDFKRKYIKQSVQLIFSLKISRKRLLWDLRYILFPHTDRWYCSLFRKDKVSGDITPNYSELDEADIRNIRETFGDKKIIITVRDPIERDWSKAKMVLCKTKKKQPDEVPDNDWFDYFDHPILSGVNDYTRLYQKWANVFGENNILMLFHDEIDENSWKVYNQICQFLGIRILEDEFQDRINQRSNVGISYPIPDRFREYLYFKHRDKMIRFAKEYDHVPYPKMWLEKYSDLEESA